jgi:predicted dehydrogenase
MPIFQYRFGDGAARARALIDAGITGRLFTASSTTWWRRGRAYYADAPWRGTWDGERGGCVLSHAIHNHDLLTWMAGPLVEVRAMTATRGQRRGDRGLRRRHRTHRRRRAGDHERHARRASGVVAARVALRQRHDHVVVRGVRPIGGPWNFEFRRSAFAEAAEQAWTDLRRSGSQYTGQFQRFVDALADGSEFPVTLADARASLELVTAWYHSAHTGSVETLPLAGDHAGRASWIPATLV